MNCNPKVFVCNIVLNNLGVHGEVMWFSIIWEFMVKLCFSLRFPLENAIHSFIIINN